MPNAAAPVTVPNAPHKFEDLHVRRTLVEDLALKALYHIGEMTVRELGGYLRLKMPVMDEVLNRLRKEKLCEVTGESAGVYRLVATVSGKARAQSALAQSQYMGVVPVSLDDYIARVHAQAQQERRDAIRVALERRVVDGPFAQQVDHGRR